MAGPLFNRGRQNRYKPLAEINVTPMVDVMLVLLIIFMVAAPLMTSGVTVDLPKASAAPLSQDSEPLTVSVNAEGKIFVQETPLELAALAPKLSALSEGKMDRRIFVRGDKGLTYGRIMEVMASITQGGFTKVALLAESAPTTPAAATPSATPPTTSPAPAASTQAPAPRRR